MLSQLRRALFLLACLCSLALLLEPLATPASAADSTVAARFQRFYAENGGAELFGTPLSGEMQADGLLVQYFSRARMEWHGEYSGTENEVLLSALGRTLTAGRMFAQVGPLPGQSYFPQTGYNLGGGFASYWGAHRGLPLFGYPISNELREISTIDGQPHTVQYFERARMEWHDGRGVVLDDLGARYLANIGGGQPPVVTAATTLTTPEQIVYDRLMGARTAAGAGLPELDPVLTAIARQRSADMAARQYFSHYTPEGKTIFVILNEAGVAWSYAGEILSRNNYAAAQSPGVAAEAYLASAPHRAVAVDPQYNAMGIGHAVDDSGMHYYTVIFVRR